LRSIEKGRETYNLVCGQGRIEALRMLGYSDVPAFIVEDDEHGCLVRSLVENVARRNHSPAELLDNVQVLRQAGYSDKDLAAKIGISVNYLQDLLALVECGEERLLAAVDNGTIPLRLAIQISKASDLDVQRALADAYADGTLKGQQIIVVQRLIQRRASTGPARPKSGSSSVESKALTPERLRKMYIKEAGKQRLLVKKAELVHARLLFIVEALKDLLSNRDFVALLAREALTTLPRALQQRLGGEIS
jgi:ParB family chromosome partitioning protein